MRTALITVGDKQQVVLQPENKQEHRILQMLLEGNKEVQVKGSQLEVTEYGGLVAKPQPTYHRVDPDRPAPVIIQVQPEEPKPKPTRNPDVLVVDVYELKKALVLMHERRQNLDSGTGEFDANVQSRATADHKEIQDCLMLMRSTTGLEPNPYLAQGC